MPEKKNYIGIDIIKLVFAFLIVLMHSDMLDTSVEIEYRLQITVFALIVPYFFISSGFFLGDKINREPYNSHSIIKRALGRYLKLYMIFGGWYFTVNVLKALMIDKDIQGVFHLLHQLIVETPGGGIWFVYTLIWCVLILLLYNKTRKDIVPLVLFFLIMYVFGAFFFSKGLDNSTARNIYKGVFLSEHNVIFYGIFFFGGLLLGLKEKIYGILKNQKMMSLLIIGLYILFGLWLYNWNNMFQSVLFSVLRGFAVFLLFVLASCIKTRNNNNTSYMRKVSTVLYFTHWNFIYVVIFLRERIGIDRIVLSLMCLLSALLFSMIILKAFNGRVYKLLFT